MQEALKIASSPETCRRYMMRRQRMPSFWLYIVLLCPLFLLAACGEVDPCSFPFSLSSKSALAPGLEDGVLFANNTVYLSGSNPQASPAEFTYALRPDTGALLWHSKVGGGPRAIPGKQEVLINGPLVGSTNTCTALNSNTGAALWEIDHCFFCPQYNTVCTSACSYIDCAQCGYRATPVVENNRFTSIY